ncbi:hypothetical protein F0562_025445 [Nyssa sinensis]|uniref:RING-type E3 ubiquitin transferase n=1 Tax=Nyssa sinensis TaxID=561372 RepID=A0A5J5BIB2_9ASTE|nr:hypothetical protein F0562_025445 [Nyssa sinensis]
MSSAGGTLVGGTPELYFCYQCNRTVTVTPSLNTDLLCPTCNGGFLEEYENPNPSPNPFHTNIDPFSAFSDPLSSFLSGLPLLFSPSSTTSDLQNPRNFSNIFGPSGTTQTRSYAQEPDPFDPFVFLQNYLATLRDGGANIQFVVENHQSEPGLRLPSNIGDYFIGPGLEQLIQHLAENDPNRYGTPPASKSAVEALPSIKADDQLLSSDLAQCAVCKDAFEHGMEVKQMPCKHVYHSDCILPWLELHNSCPVCRYELPTDDPDYENRSLGMAGSGNLNVGSGSSGGGSQGSSQGQRTVERRFRISLPLPFEAFGSPAETSDGALSANGGNNGGGSNSGDQQNRDFGSGQARLELRAGVPYIYVCLSTWEFMFCSLHQRLAKLRKDFGYENQESSLKQKGDFIVLPWMITEFVYNEERCNIFKVLDLPNYYLYSTFNIIYIYIYCFFLIFAYSR